MLKTLKFNKHKLFSLMRAFKENHVNLFKADSMFYEAKKWRTKTFC